MRVGLTQGAAGALAVGVASLRCDCSQSPAHALRVRGPLPDRNVAFDLLVRMHRTDSAFRCLACKRQTSANAGTGRISRSPQDRLRYRRLRRRRTMRARHETRGSRS